MEPRSWYVLLASSPERTEHRLMQVNMEEEENGRPACFRLFVPYTALQGSGEGDKRPDSGVSLRAALNRYVFIQGDEDHLRQLMLEWNRAFNDRLYFLKTGSMNYARISQADMDKLMKACLGDAGLLDLSVSLGEVKAGQKISLVNTPFERDDCDYEVVSVKKKKGGTMELQVKMKLFGIDLDNITITYKDTADSESNASLVASAQRTLLDIFRRRVNRKETPLTRHEDNKALDELYTHCDTVFPEGAMKRHFLALMLICSHLKGDEAGVTRFQSAVEKELADISRLRESKAATDTRAYLHIALYIATRQVKYREMAKSYVRKYNPLSSSLRRFVSTMSKNEAGKWIGPRACKHRL